MQTLVARASERVAGMARTGLGSGSPCSRSPSRTSTAAASGHLPPTRHSSSPCLFCHRVHRCPRRRLLRHQPSRLRRRRHYLRQRSHPRRRRHVLHRLVHHQHRRPCPRRHRPCSRAHRTWIASRALQGTRAQKGPSTQSRARRAAWPLAMATASASAALLAATNRQRAPRTALIVRRGLTARKEQQRRSPAPPVPGTVGSVPHPYTAATLAPRARRARQEQRRQWSATRAVSHWRARGAALAARLVHTSLQRGSHRATHVPRAATASRARRRRSRAHPARLPASVA
jgi:hypothetical protein